VNLSGRTRSLLVFLGLALLGALLYQFAWTPLNEQIDEARAEALAAEADLREARDIASRSQEIENQIGECKETLRQLSRRIPTSAEQPRLLVYIEQSATASDLTVMGLGCYAPEPGKKFAIVPLEVNLTGPYRGHVEFCRRMEEMERLVNPLGVVLEAVPEGEVGFAVSGSYRFRLYVDADTPYYVSAVPPEFTGRTGRSEPFAPPY